MPTTFTLHEPAAEVIERLTAEGPIGLTAAGRIIKRHPATLARWCVDGLQLSDGTTLRLESYRLGGKLTTSRPALFHCTAALMHSKPPASIQTPASHRRADAESCKFLGALASEEPRALTGCRHFLGLDVAGTIHLSAVACHPIRRCQK